VLRFAPVQAVSQPRSRRSGGFTLLELMVAITLFGILVMLAAPAFTSWVRNAQVRTAAEALQGGFRTAQAEALRRNRQVVLFFTDDNPAKNVSSTQLYTDAAPSATGKKWALQTVPGSWGTTEYITGGALTDVAATVAFSGGAAAICWDASGRMAQIAAGSSGTGVSVACSKAVTTFAVAQTTTRTDDRPLRVVLQLGGQVRMCDPARPTLSATSPDGCP
jgi:type IV fimbrial biogenesis protein FimT